jgi:hypothetical protein
MLKNIRFDISNLEENITIDADSIMDYRYENIDPVPVMYQSGYLTIKSYDKFFNEYTLGYPNEEVKYGFLKELLPEYLNGLPTTEFDVRKFCRDLMANNVKQFMLRLQTAFSDIPFDLENKTEKHYQTIFYLLFKMMGQFIKTEEHSSAGSSDAVVDLPERIYIFEFKLDGNGTVEEALKQIDTKGYARKYKLSGKEIIKIGAVFDNEKRTIKEWEARN